MISLAAATDYMPVRSSQTACPTPNSFYHAPELLSIPYRQDAGERPGGFKSAKCFIPETGTALHHKTCGVIKILSLTEGIDVTRFDPHLLATLHCAMQHGCTKSFMPVRFPGTDRLDQRSASFLGGFRSRMQYLDCAAFIQSPAFSASISVVSCVNTTHQLIDKSKTYKSSGRASGIPGSCPTDLYDSCHSNSIRSAN